MRVWALNLFTLILHQNPLSLSLLQHDLRTTKELMIMDIQKPIAKIVAL